MGLIIENLKSTDKFVGTANECTDCNKAVAGMENKDESLSSRDEKGAGTAVDKTTEDGKRYVLADGPVSNMFTKALQVKFNNGDKQAELANRRPTASITSSDNPIENIGLNTSNESAAQDVMHQHEYQNQFDKQVVAKENTTRIQISKTHGNPRDPVTVNPMHAFKSIMDTGIDVDFVLMKGESPNGTTNLDTCVPEMEEVKRLAKNSVGKVQGMIANENLQILSVEVLVKYK